MPALDSSTPFVALRRGCLESSRSPASGTGVRTPTSVHTRGEGPCFRAGPGLHGDRAVADIPFNVEPLRPNSSQTLEVRIRTVSGRRLQPYSAMGSQLVVA